MPLTKKLGTSLKMRLEKLRLWNNSWLLTPYGCPEFMFVSGGGPDVRTVSRAYHQYPKMTTMTRSLLIAPPWPSWPPSPWIANGDSCPYQYGLMAVSTVITFLRGRPHPILTLADGRPFFGSKSKPV